MLEGALGICVAEDDLVGYPCREGVAGFARGAGGAGERLGERRENEQAFCFEEVGPVGGVAFGQGAGDDVDQFLRGIALEDAPDFLFHRGVEAADDGEVFTAQAVGPVEDFQDGVAGDFGGAEEGCGLVLQQGGVAEGEHRLLLDLDFVGFH